MIEKGQRIKPGDILRNDWAGDDNPHKYTMYLGRAKACGQQTFKCLAYNNSIVHHCASNNRLVVVGHLKEYDEFIDGLKNLFKWSDATMNEKG